VEYEDETGKRDENDIACKSVGNCAACDAGLVAKFIFAVK
jgi:hypothetical protein